jgi:hypothetical protein
MLVDEKIDMVSAALLSLAMIIPLGHQDQEPAPQEETQTDSLVAQETLLPAPVAPERAETDRYLQEPYTNATLRCLGV